MYGSVGKTKWSLLKWREAQALLGEATLVKVENISQERISIISFKLLSDNGSCTLEVKGLSLATAAGTGR